MSGESCSTENATLIIAQHDGLEMTLSCLRSIRQHEKTSWPIVVTDDGSFLEHRQALLETEIENLTLIFQEHRFLTVAWNRAAKICETPYLIFLNNDVTIEDKFVSRLIEPLTTDRAVMTGVRYREEKALPQVVLDILPAQRFLEGWCFALKKETFDTLSGFDTEMKLYFSDTDFQLRIVELTGNPNSLMEVHDLPVKHLGHRTAHRLQNRNELWQQDRKTFIEKWRDAETVTGL